MLRSIKNKLVILVAALTLTVPAIIPLQSASAACNNVGNGISKGISDTQGTNSTGSPCGSGGSIIAGVGTLAGKVVNIFSIVVGIVSVLMIIFAGFKYVTSGGDSNSVSGAKNTLVYSIIGLIIVVLAQLVVHYVLNTASSVGGQSGY